MTKLKFVNYYMFQWFGVRLEQMTENKTDETVEWNIIYPIVPMTGWKNDYKYVYGNRIKRFLIWNKK